jgi:hypothetical protein
MLGSAFPSLQWHHRWFWFNHAVHRQQHGQTQNRKPHTVLELRSRSDDPQQQPRATS